ncbi:TniQ family protein [Pseudomonas yamanorum]
MDAPNQCRWSACANPVDAVWPLVPTLLQDEVISSWLVRCALAQGCGPTTLTSEAWPERRFWCNDPDRELTPKNIIILSRLSGIPTDALLASTLQPLYRLMAGTSLFPRGTVQWFLCLGCRSRRRCGGLQYCPLCFREQTPHYRIQSRLAWHTVCPAHGVSLLDHCESCLAPLCPQLLHPPEETIGRCHRCGYDLSRASPKVASDNALKFQSATDGIFFGAPARYGEYRLALAQWLSLSRWMIGILRSAMKAQSPCTKNFFRELGVSLESLRPPSTGLPFEFLAPSERADLLTNVWNMLQAGPDRMMLLAEQERIRASLLLPRSGEVPIPLAAFARPLQTKKRHSSIQSRLDEPRPPKSVLMRWHRLLRKFQR